MTNTSLLKFALSAALSLGLACTAIAEVVVIVHPSNPAALDSKSVKRIYLGKSNSFPSGNEAIPINQSADSQTRQSFDSDVLGRSTSQISAYWSKLVFTGKGIPPKEVADDNAVISLVANNKDAIGYIDSASVNDSVKVITTN